MAPEIVGREEELSALFAALDTWTGASGLSAVAIEGEAGIGKTTLWRAAAGRARDRALPVLVARPAQSERGFAHAALGDLLHGVLDDVLPALTAPRRRALEVALLLEEDAGGRRADPRALGVAVRSALEVLADDRGVVLAIDDLQWLDAPSVGALAFALRRLRDAQILLLWSSRLDESSERSQLEDGLDPERIRRIHVGPLTVGALHGVVRARLDHSLPRPTLLRLHDVSGGNPFYGLELARALGNTEAAYDPTRPLPVPERLEELLSARLGSFTGSTRDALVLAAAHARVTTNELRAAGADPDALEPALDERVVELTAGAVRFAHPLLASTLYQGLAPAERRRAHRRLARVVRGSVARARHLALSTDRPAAKLAATLEREAAAAARQGMPVVAAELGEHALRLTPPDEGADLDRRAMATAQAHVAAGMSARARTLATELVQRSTPGLARAEALQLLADAEGEDIRRGITLRREALVEADGHPALQASLHAQLALACRFVEGLEAAERHATAAVALAEPLADDDLRAAALAGLALIRFNAGRPDAVARAQEAYALSSEGGTSLNAADAAFALAHVLVWSGELDRARDVLERLLETWQARDEQRAASATWYLALVELRAGRLELARERAEQARALSAEYLRDDEETPQTLFPLALACAHRGDLARARELAAAMRTRAERHAARLQSPVGTAGAVELWSGDAEAAVAAFEEAEAITDAADVAEPGMTWWRAEQVEALLELGRVSEAADRLEAWEADARRLDRAWTLAQATRCRGLVAAARGDLDQAVARLEEAATAHESVGDPLGRARALLALGVTRRRAKQKRPAREALEEAAAAFEEIGAAGWAKRARREIGRIGGRTRSDELTPAERRVADLVGQGRTNAEVAAALFLSERTVASHLTRVYAKLGVRSRTELARRLG